MKNSDKAKKIIFISVNEDKTKEVSLVLGKFNIAVTGRKVNFDEIADSRLEHIVLSKARQVSRIIRSPFIVDDAGIFFNAYPRFPGVFTKHAFKSLGYGGMLKLLQNKNRGAFFKTVIAYVDSGKNIFLFKGICRGHISHSLKGPASPFSPFNRLFIPDGKRKTFAQMGMGEQAKNSHRAKALRQFARFYSGSD
jgi:XTP/dITP diphosphohydrolase